MRIKFLDENPELKEFLMQFFEMAKAPLALYALVTVFIFFAGWTYFFYACFLLALYRVLLLTRPEERYDAEKRLVCADGSVDCC